MPHGVTHAILPLVHQLVRILPILRNVPDIIANYPRRIPYFFEETLRLLRSLLHRRGNSQSGEPKEFESAHLRQTISQQGKRRR